jgi:hypothetical protein
MRTSGVDGTRGGKRIVFSVGTSGRKRGRKYSSLIITLNARNSVKKEREGETDREEHKRENKDI